MTVPTFFSYAYENRRLAGHIKQRLEVYGFDVFLAHDDIEPSKVWQAEILKHLRTCKVFLALLTEEFDESDWAHQEIGIAYARSRTRPVMVPINAGRSPVGFLAGYQAIRIDPELVTKAYLDNACSRIVKSAAQKNIKITKEVRSALIGETGQINSYDDAGALFTTLEEIDGLTPDEMKHVLTLASRNSQVYESRSAHRPIRRLIETHKKNINKTALNNFYKVWVYAPGKD